MADVLIVEDDPSSGEALTMYLRHSGHHVRWVYFGEAALTGILERIPDVIVLDLMIPDVDGPGLLEVLRSYLRLQSLPVVVWTGLSEGPLVDHARALQVNSILHKSKATFEDVLKAIKQAVAAPGPSK
jgi:CheY-like chemotaxis protein